MSDGYPLHVFRFLVEFVENPLDGGGGGPLPLCDGAFAECTGLEATMEPKVIREGGRNYGAAQRSGPVSFATIVLRRGMTRAQDLYGWFELVTSGATYAHRLNAYVTLFDTAGEIVLRWKLERALPIKFKAADLNARASEVGIEELHLAHEGLHLA
jgi:phage tail-like protein